MSSFASAQTESLTHSRGCGFGKNTIYDETPNNTLRSGSHKIMLENINEARKKATEEQRKGRKSDRRVKKWHFPAMKNYYRGQN